MRMLPEAGASRAARAAARLVRLASRAAARLVRRRGCSRVVRRHGSCGGASRAAVAVFPKPHPRTSRERFEPAGAVGTRCDGTATLSPRLKPELRGRIQRSEAGSDAYQSGDTVLGGSGTLG